MEFQQYHTNIISKIEQSTEYTLQTDFEILLNKIKPRKTVEIVQEHKTQSGVKARPDFKVDEKLSIILAKHAQYLHDELLKLWNDQEKSAFKEKLQGLYNLFSNGNFDENGNGFLFKDESRKDNFTKEFRCFLKSKKLQEFAPESILGYIYAVLFCPTYRQKYFEFFKIDFPKIPFIENTKVFENLASLGQELIEHHLLKRNYKRNEMPVFAIEGNNKTENYYFDATKQRLYINKNQYFEQFQSIVWEYEIGGYQIFDKYLKARKNVELSYAEINHIKKVAASITITIEIQREIDNLCTTWI